MITVLTPTFNRAHTLTRAFESLGAQTDDRFEWLVVDDGSTDGTQDLLRGLRDQAHFKMVVAGQDNQGKHVAINTGSGLASGEWVFILDSDDALTPDAIARLHDAIEGNPDPDLAGVCFRRSYFEGGLVGNKIVREPRLFLHPTEAGTVFGGDLAYVFRLSALRSHPFPVIPGEKFFPELYVWNRIGDDGPILYFADETIYRCEYLPDGYTANFMRILKRNPKGLLVYYRDQYSRERAPIRKLKCFVRALQCSWYVFAGRVRP